MKRFLIFAVLFSLLGACFAYLLENKSSYVLLTYESYAFESSLWFFAIALIIFYFVLNFSLAVLLKLYLNSSAAAFLTKTSISGSFSSS